MGAALPPPARDGYGLGYEKNDRNKKRKDAMDTNNLDRNG